MKSLIIGLFFRRLKTQIADLKVQLEVVANLTCEEREKSEVSDNLFITQSRLIHESKIHIQLVNLVRLLGDKNTMIDC